MKIKITYKIEYSDQVIICDSLQEFEKKIKSVGKMEVEYYAYKIVETGKSTKETFLIQ